MMEPPPRSTPLHMACRISQLDCVVILLDGGADETMEDGTHGLGVGGAAHDLVGARRSADQGVAQSPPRTTPMDVVGLGKFRPSEDPEQRGDEESDEEYERRRHPPTMNQIREAVRRAPAIVPDVTQDKAQTNGRGSFRFDGSSTPPNRWVRTNTNRGSGCGHEREQGCTCLDDRCIEMRSARTSGSSSGSSKGKNGGNRKGRAPERDSESCRQVSLDDDNKGRRVDHERGEALGNTTVDSRTNKRARHDSSASSAVGQTTATGPQEENTVMPGAADGRVGVDIDDEGVMCKGDARNSSGRDLSDMFKNGGVLLDVCRRLFSLDEVEELFDESCLSCDCEA